MKTGSLTQTPRILGRLAAALGLALVLIIGLTSLAKASTATDDVAAANGNIAKALTAAKAGNFEEARKAYKIYDDTWFSIEDGVREESLDSYQAIEAKMGEVNTALAKNPPDGPTVILALQRLDAEQQAYIKGQPAGTGVPAGVTPSEPAPTASANVTMASLLGLLTKAQAAQTGGDYPTAATAMKQFQTDWLVVEGQVKTRSGDDYRDTENDMAIAYNLLVEKSPDSKAVLDRTNTRLQPYLEETKYGIFDASIILLREGLEALLVVIALLTFLRKSGNDAKQPWIWGGVLAGLAASIILGILIQILFSNIVNPTNREMIEGVTGLFAAVMLIYVSYWMHNKSSAASWNRYIKSRSTAALAKGSLFGLAALSFLAIFREGAETVLFFLGMGSSISLADLLIGLAIGAVALGIIGFLLVVIGVRIPMGPFFLVASILVFYLCFKFVGTGIHALQVGKVLPATTASYLPENGFLGLFPTWETTIPQLLLLALAIGVVVLNMIKDRRETTKAAATPA